MNKIEATNYLKVTNLSKSFGSFMAVRNINIEIKEGEFACFLGPSGCGKTTLLRCIAGLELQTNGSITQKNIEISQLPPSARDFGIVFQSYALFPNLTVFANISYGLVNEKWGRNDVKKRVNELLDLVGLADHSEKFPSQLSGGEQQRVALARALATSPGLLLLDEPLSALDAKVRVYLRKQIKDLHRELGVTTIMVTHDQEEAQSMADRIFVMKDGEVIQSGAPQEIYNKANSAFIADFIGVTNFVDGVVEDEGHVKSKEVSLSCNAQSYSVGQAVRIAIRPECISINSDQANNENGVEAKLEEVEFLGSFQRLYLTCPSLGVNHFMVDVANHVTDPYFYKPGVSLSIVLSAQHIRVYAVD